MSCCLSRCTPGLPVTCGKCFEEFATAVAASDEEGGGGAGGSGSQSRSVSAGGGVACCVASREACWRGCIPRWRENAARRYFRSRASQVTCPATAPWPTAPMSFPLVY